MERGTRLKRYDNAIIQTGRQVAINVTGLRAVILFIRGIDSRGEDDRSEKRRKEGEEIRLKEALSLFGG